MHDAIFFYNLQRNLLLRDLKLTKYDLNLSLQFANVSSPFDHSSLSNISQE